VIATNSGVLRPGSTVFHVSIELKEEGVVKVLFSFLKCYSNLLLIIVEYFPPQDEETPVTATINPLSIYHCHLYTCFAITPN